MKATQFKLLTFLLLLSTASFAQWSDAGTNIPTLASSTTPVIHYSDSLNQLFLLRESEPSGTTYFDTLSRITDEWGVYSSQINAVDFVTTDAGTLTFLDTISNNFSLTSYDAQLNFLWTTSPPAASVNYNFYSLESVRLVKGVGDDYFLYFMDTQLNQFVVHKYDGTSWTTLGTITDYISELKVDSNGVPYFLYAVPNGSTQTTHHIRSFDGSQWPIIASHTDFNHDDHSFSIDSNNDIYLFHLYTDGVTFGILAGVEYFSNGAFTNLASINLGPFASLGIHQSTVDRNDKFHGFLSSYDLGWTSLHHFFKDDQLNNWTFGSPETGVVAGLHSGLNTTVDELNCIHLAYNIDPDPFDPLIPNDVVVRKFCQCIFLDSINTVTLDQNNMLSSTITSYPLDYQWIDCSTNLPIPGATNSTFTPQQNGSYALISSSINSCADTSACVAVSTIGIDELASTHYSIHPNPTSNQLTITSKFGGTAKVHLTITDLKGKVLIEEITNEGNPISVEMLASGTYFIRIEEEGSAVIVPFVKQ